MEKHDVLEALPCISAPSPPHKFISLLPIEIQKLEISPVCQRTRSVTGADQKCGHANNGNEIKRKKQNELDNLAEGKRSIDRGLGGFTQPFQRVAVTFFGNRAESRNQVGTTLFHEDGVEDVDLCLVDEECFEQDGDDGGTFSENQEGSVKPGTSVVEDCQKSDLR
jgi:hypothetical protein